MVWETLKNKDVEELFLDSGGSQDPSLTFCSEDQYN